MLVPDGKQKAGKRERLIERVGETSGVSGAAPRSPGRPTWTAMQPGAVKHDTFVFGRDGLRTLFWGARVRDLAQWSTDIQAAVVALGR